MLLVAVPYSLKSSDADTLGGLPASAYALAGSTMLVAPAGDAHPAEAGQAGQAAGSASSPQPLAACTAVTSDGTATANTVAKFTAPCKVENSMMRDNGTGVAVGGTSPPGALLDVQYTSTATTGALLGQRVLSTLSPSAASSATTYGIFSNALTASGNTKNFTGNIFALDSELDHNGKGILTSGFGMKGAVYNRAAGTITNAYGINAALSNLSTGKITNGYGVYVNAPTNSGGGTFSNYSGLYIASPTAAVPGAYGLYSAGGKNYFGGNVGIGTTTPGAFLEVNGTTKFDGLVTFKSGQTFPGAGTVTSVASGAGLTGGPITSTGTLSIASAGLTDAMLANAYSGVGSCATGKVVMALARNATPTCVTASTGTVTSVGSGSGLTGGPITGTGSLSIASGGVSDSMLASPYSGVGTCAAGNVVKALARNAGPTCVAAGTGTVASITAGTGLSGGTITTSGTINNTGVLSVGVNPGITTTGGQNPTLGIDTTVVPTLGARNTWNNINTFYGAQRLGVNEANPGWLYAYAGGNSAFLGYSNPTNPAYPTMYLENDASGDTLSEAWVFQTNGYNYGGQCTIDVSGDLMCNGEFSDVISSADGTAIYAANATGTAIAAGNSPTDASNPTMFLENDAVGLPGALIFEATGPPYYSDGVHISQGCEIDVSGNLTCTGSISGRTTLPLEKRQVGLYTVQSSENWIEDFGSGALVNGVASIDIEPEFAQTVSTEAGYHVFLTPKGDCEGLYVNQEGASSFEVRELKSGKSNVQFDYRIVAHRKGFESARLPDITAKFQKRMLPPSKVKAPVVRRPVRATSQSVLEEQKAAGRPRQ